MQKSIQSKALSLFLSALLCLTVFAAVEITIPNAYAADSLDVGGYEVSFATGGNTAADNGITVTADLVETGMGSADIRATGERGRVERVGVAFQFSGNATADGLLTVDFSGEKGTGGTVDDSISVYVKAGKPVTNSLGNTLYMHISKAAVAEFEGITDIELSLNFDAMTTYELKLDSATQTVNGMTFNVWVADSSGYYPADEEVYLELDMSGESSKAGTYTVTVTSAKVGYHQTLTIPTHGDDWFEIEPFDMPNDDVNDFTLTVTFAASSSGSSSSSSGGSSRDVTYTPPSKPAPAPITSAKAVESVKAAIAAAKNSPNGATVKLQNVSDISLDAMKQMTKAAGDTALKVNADNLNADGSVDVRISIDPSKATSALNLAASTTSREATSVGRTFTKYFNNKVSVVSLSQKGNFGMPVTVAAKVDKTLNPETLVFYSYNSETNSYSQIKDPQYRIDKNGYVHFTTSVGGEMIISDKPLTRK